MDSRDQRSHRYSSRDDGRDGPTQIESSSRRRSRERSSDRKRGSRYEDRHHAQRIRERRQDNGWGGRVQEHGGRTRRSPSYSKRDDRRAYDKSESPPLKRRRRSSSGELDPGHGKELVKRRRREHSEERGLRRRSRSPNDRNSEKHLSKSSDDQDEKDKPDFKNSGLLAAATNTVKRADGTSTVLKYNEPPEARKPIENWRLYDFHDEDEPVVFAINKQSAYLFGRDFAVVDIPLDHPSCSKQHAVIQFRQVLEKNEYGDKKSAIKPFVIDLESTNGTHVNGEAIPTSRYYELRISDVIKFGTSTREFVLLHENAAE